MSTLAEQKKLILPYLQRADEIQSLNPKVAYYCRLHAIEQGLQIPNRAPEIQDVLELLMEKLEQDKPLITMSDDDAALCEAFAVRVFKTADRQDREGKADTKTVRAFYAASIFIDVLEHFGELPPDMVERKQYAFWKAADIRKALREGRKPDPGPPVQEDDLGLDLPDIPGSTLPEAGMPSSQASAGPGPANSSPKSSASLPEAPKSALQQQQPTARFRPGSKVFYNSPHGRPAKGTVVITVPDVAGIVYRVGLSAEVLAVPEAQLAHDFAAGDRVLFRQKGGSTEEATVERFDVSRCNGQSVPTTEDALSPAVSHEASAPSTHEPVIRSHDSAAARRHLSGAERDPAATHDSTSASREAGVAGHDSGHDGREPAAGNFDTEVAGHEAALAGRDSAAAHVPTPDASGSSSPRHVEGPSDEAFGHAPEGRTSFHVTPQNDMQEGHSDVAHQLTSDTAPEPDDVLPPGTEAEMDDSAADAHMPRASDRSEDHSFAPDGFHPSYPGVSYHSGGIAPAPSPQPPPQIPMPPQFIQQGLRGPPPHIDFPSSHPSSYPAMPPTEVPQQPSGGVGNLQPGSRRVPNDVGALPPPTPGYDPPLAAMTEAQRSAKNAVSAISFEDVPTAVKNLQRALELLTVPGSRH